MDKAVNGIDGLHFYHMRQNLNVASLLESAVEGGHLSQCSRQYPECKHRTLTIDRRSPPLAAVRGNIRRAKARVDATPQYAPIKAR